MLSFTSTLSPRFLYETPFPKSLLQTFHALSLDIYFESPSISLQREEFLWQFEVFLVLLFHDGEIGSFIYRESAEAIYLFVKWLSFVV